MLKVAQVVVQDDGFNFNHWQLHFNYILQPGYEFVDMHSVIFH